MPETYVMDDSLYTLEFKWETSMLLGSILNTVEVFWGFKVTGEKNMEQFNMVKNCPAQNSKSLSLRNIRVGLTW